MRLTAGSLFSGVGMFDLAFALAGFDILFQVEIDTYCQKVLRKHAATYWPHAEIHADVCGVGRHNLPAIDVLFGGFPCQDISSAGRGEGIHAGTRSGLWFEFKRIIGELRPRVVLLENVAAITRKDGIIVISDLAEMGYDAKWGVISAADTGAPHLRERWWCIAVGDTSSLRRDEQQASERCNCHEERHNSQAEQGRDNEFPSTVLYGEVEHADIERREERDPAACNRGTRHISGGFDTPSMVNSASLTRQTDGEGTGNRSLQSRIEREGNEDKPRMGGSPDGSAARLDGHRLMSHVFPVGPHMAQPETEAPRMAAGNKNTNNRLKALGNGGLPQIVYPIACEIRDLLTAK